MLRKTLATLPKTLNQTYERILLNIDEEYAAYAKRFMKWLAYSARPLQLKELAEIVTVEVAEEPRVDPLRRLPDPQDVLTICSSLVIVKQSISVPILQLTEPEDLANTRVAAPDNIDHEAEDSLDNTAKEDGPYHFEVTLAHFSVKEYLISTDIQTGPVKDYSVTEKNASNSIAQTCLAYLLQFNAERTLTYQAIWKFPLALYAAQHWASHYKDGKEEGGLLTQLAMELLRSSAFSNCVSLYHLINVFNRSPFDNSRTIDRSFLPLHYTCAHGMTDLVKCVLEESAKVEDINATSPFGTALAIASFRGHLNTVKVLLDNNANVNCGPPISSSALYRACCEGHEAIVRLLLNSKADADLIGGDNGTALHAATVSQNEGIVRVLLDHKVNLNISVDRWGTALHIASREGLESIARLLLERGADVDADGDQDGNALQSASLRGHEAVVRLLLEHGADVNKLGGRNGSPLGAAMAGKHFAIVGVLLDAGADVNLSGRGYYDETNNVYVACQPHLHTAIFHNLPDIMRLLLEKGARANARNNEKRTALSAALKAGASPRSVSLLLEHGASLLLLDDTDMERFNKLRPKLGLATEANDDREDG